METLEPAAASPEVDRELFVYLPASYGEGRRRYPVLYLQDGQNLFDPALSYAGSWRVDLAMDAAAGQGHEAIAVGIPNAGGGRLAEYGPFDDPVHGAGQADRYLEWLAGPVKGLVDRRYRTQPGRAATAIVGSSMGGLISLYGLVRRPEVFGVVGALSPSLWYGGRGIFPALEAAPHRPARIYLDVGRREGAEALADVRRLRDLLVARGYRRGHDLRYVEDRKGAHDEAAWGRRFREALPFLLSPTE